MSRPDVVALLGADLMFASRLQAALRPEDVVVASITGDDDVLPPASLIFVDLNTQTEARLAAIGRLRTLHPEAIIVGFCDHAEREVLRRAMTAGATHVVANRHLGEAARRLVGASDLAELGTSDGG